MDLAEKEHRENLNEMEYKFFKEKVSEMIPVTSHPYSYDKMMTEDVVKLLWHRSAPIQKKKSPQARLEKEAERKIALVVNKAHNEAVVWVCFHCVFTI